MAYFNHRLHQATSRWQRWEFLRNWWHIQSRDRQWTPPYYPALWRELTCRQNPHLARLHPRFLYLEGMYQAPETRHHGLTLPPAPMAGIWETPLAATAVTIDPRRSDRTAYLALFHCVNDRDKRIPDGPARLAPLQPTRLAADFLPLLAAACQNRTGFAPPDAAEATFLLRWMGARTLSGWLAIVSGSPVGFVLLQADFAWLLRRARGDRNWLWRLWLILMQPWPLRHGRLLFGGVLPSYRRQGIGRQLLRAALETARQQGWRSLTVGPLPESDTAVTLLQQFGAQPRQTYQLYEWSF